MIYTLFYFISIIIIYFIPFLLTVLPVFLMYGMIYKIFYLLFTPLIFSSLFLFCIFLIIRKVIKLVKEGIYIFDQNSDRLNLLKIYNICWYAVYDFRPLYYTLLAFPVLRKILFNIFGYKGNNDFIIHHDTWIKDVKLLNLKKGVFIANKAILGTSIFLNDSSIFFGKIDIGQESLIGHLTIVSPGCIINDHVEIASHSVVGMNSKINNNSFISFFSTLNHNVEIGENVAIGAYTFIGQNSKISNNVKIPENSNIPPNTIIMDQEGIEEIINKENESLLNIKEKAFECLRGNFKITSFENELKDD